MFRKLLFNAVAARRTGATAPASAASSAAASAHRWPRWPTSFSSASATPSTAADHAAPHGSADTGHSTFNEKENALLVYDGECTSCNNAMRYVLNRDHTGLVHFAPLQSEFAADMLRRHGISQQEARRSLVFIEPDRCSVSSDAVLRVATFLDTPDALLCPMRLVPRPLREAGVDAISRHRDALFDHAEPLRVSLEEAERRVHRR